MNNQNEQLKTAYEQYRKEIKKLDVEADLMNPVFGEGPLPCSVMFVGEAPGAQEAKEGRPFIGKAGKQLDEMLSEVMIDRNRVFVSNAVKYRPTKNDGRANRTPTTKEINAARWLLDIEIEKADPKVIVALGNSPLFAIVKDSKIKIGEVHGQFQNLDGRLLFPIYHPASLIYNPSLRDTFRKDLSILAKWIRDEVK